MVPEPPETSFETPLARLLRMRARGHIGLQGISTETLFTTAWNSVPALGSVNAGDWYHMQVEGIDFGKPGASYTLRLSDPNGSAFTKTAGGLTFGQTTAISANPAQSFVFNTAFGTNPGFSVDNITVTAFAPVPEPSTALLGGLTLLGFLRRRR